MVTRYVKKAPSLRRLSRNGANRPELGATASSFRPSAGHSLRGLDRVLAHSHRDPEMELVCSACSTRNRVPAKRLRDKAKCASCKAALLPLATPVAVASAHDFDELVRDAPSPVLVDFWAAWCGPCRMVAPELEKIARESGTRVIVVKVDTEALPLVAQRFAIRSIPTMILFRNGAEDRRLNGAMPAAEIARQLAL